jgi:hypothetical protein
MSLQQPLDYVYITSASFRHRYISLQQALDYIRIISLQQALDYVYTDLRADRVMIGGGVCMLKYQRRRRADLISARIFGVGGGGGGVIKYKKAKHNRWFFLVTFSHKVHFNAQLEMSNIKLINKCVVIMYKNNFVNSVWC